MDANNPITAAIFSAFLKCPTKAYLLAIGEPAPGTYFADIETHISSMYKAAAKRRLRVGTDMAEPLNFGEIWRNPGCATITHDVDCETAIYDFALPPHRPGAANRRNQASMHLCPRLFYPGTSRTFPTACPCVSVRSRCRRPPGYWQTPEH